MSKQYPGGFITANPTAPTSSAAPGIWTLDQAQQYIKAGTWPLFGLPGQQAYTSAGTYTWVAPAGVTSVSVVVVSAGNAGGMNGSGGALAYKNNYAVTAGTSYTVVVNSDLNSRSERSYFGSTDVVSAGVTTARTGDGGGDGGSGYRGGGGAGGYSGAGGSSNPQAPGNSGAGGGGGGGGGFYIDGTATLGGAGGGGVGILGQGSSGAGGYGGFPASYAYGGEGGSGGAKGGDMLVPYLDPAAPYAGPGGDYGGGASLYANSSFSRGGKGAVRIIWPGTTRSFPSTNTGDL